MENENKKELMRIFYKNKMFNKVAIGFLLVGIFLFAIGIIIQSRELPNALALEDVTQEDQYVKEDVYAITDYFATYSEDDIIKDKYYLAVGDSMLYILNLDYNQYVDICTELESNLYTVTGMSEPVSDELKKLAIDTYNEIYETDALNESNFETVFSAYLINAKRTPNDGAQIFKDLGIISLLCSVIFVIIYIVIILRTKRNIRKVAEEYDLAQISIELSFPSKLEYQKTKTIFLDTYVIDYSTALDVIRYEDIVWVYPNEHRINGIKSAQQIVVVTKDKKRRVIAETDAFGKENKKQFESTYNELAKRRPNALFGYTKENIDAMSKKNIDETIDKITEKDLKE